MDEITHDEAVKRLENASYFLSGQPDAACLGIDQQDGHPYRDEMAASLLCVRDFILAQQRAASVRVVRPIETVIHPGGRHSTPEVFDLKPGQEIAVIERRAEAAADGVKDGHVRLPDGREVKVLGTLPLTADGCLAGIACTLWLEDANWQTMRRPQFYEKEMARAVNLSRAYSTKEAAEAAAGEGA